MQISDLVGQYHQSNTPGTEKMTGTKGVENLVASLRSLTKGNIFEGTVSSMKNGRVTLALSSGQQVSARVDGKVDLNIGQSMFFQVKSNDGSQIAIRPFIVDGNGVNYTLMQALSAAGLPAESNYLSMVNRMMEEQMPIDRSSLQHMARLVTANGEIDVQTLVQMSKLGIEISPENAAQFENYMDDKQAITKQLDEFMNQLPDIISGDDYPAEQMRSFGEKMLSIITDRLPDVSKQQEAATSIEENAAQAQIQEQVQTQEQMPGQTQEQAQIHEQIQNSGQIPGQEQVLPENPEEMQQTQNPEMVKEDSGEEVRQQLHKETETTEIEKETVVQGKQPAPHTLGAVLSDAQMKNLNRMIGKLLATDATVYTKESGIAEVLKDLKQVLGDHFPMEHEAVKKLFSSEEFKSLIHDTLEQQWTIRPEELAKDQKIENLYNRLSAQMGQIEHAMKAAGIRNTDFVQTAADIRSNIEFMNQINQTYTYVQIPMKMSGKNASAELFVYTNKKALAEGTKNLTAFLHLDMEHLGSTDVSVKLSGRDVSTNFYMENDEAYELLRKNLPVLGQRLQKKGYSCKMSVINESKKVNFVEDFLKKDQPSAGQLHRYSFDMRA